MTHLTVRSPRLTTALPFLVVLLALGSAGCFGELFEGFGLEPDFDDHRTRVNGASLQGDLGPSQGLNHNATSATADEYGDSVTVEITVDRPGAAAMTVVTLREMPPTVELREGEQTTVYDSRAPSRHSGRVTVLGCAGPRAGEWSYDEYSDDLVVLVERRRYNGRNVLTYHFVADFSYYDYETSRTELTTVSGSFDLDG